MDFIEKVDSGYYGNEHCDKRDEFKIDIELHFQSNELSNDTRNLIYKLASSNSDSPSHIMKIYKECIGFAKWIDYRHTTILTEY